MTSHFTKKANFDDFYFQSRIILKSKIKYQEEQRLGSACAAAHADRRAYRLLTIKLSRTQEDPDQTAQLRRLSRVFNIRGSHKLPFSATQQNCGWSGGAMVLG